MKIKTNSFICFIVLFFFMINYFIPIEKIGHEIVSITIDIFQPDETFQLGQNSTASNAEAEHDRA